MEIISRKDALAIGQNWYYTGKACARGHYSRRQIWNGHCQDCVDLKMADPEHLRALNDRRKLSYLKRRETILAKQKEYLARPEVAAARKAYDRERSKRPERMEAARLRQREFGKTESRKQYLREYWAQRRQNDPLYRAKLAARVILRHSMQATKVGKTWARTSQALGYTPERLRAHIESLFTEGMTWQNHGEWHIDHIVPIMEFVRLGVTDLARINALANLRPIWAQENYSKCDDFTLAAYDPKLQAVLRAS